MTTKSYLVLVAKVVLAEFRNYCHWTVSNVNRSVCAQYWTFHRAAHVMLITNAKVGVRDKSHETWQPCIESEFESYGRVLTPWILRRERFRWRTWLSNASLVFSTHSKLVVTAFHEISYCHCEFLQYLFVNFDPSRAWRHSTLKVVSNDRRSSVVAWWFPRHQARCLEDLAYCWCIWRPRFLCKVEISICIHLHVIPITETDSRYDSLWLTKCILGRNWLRLDGFALADFVLGRHTHDIFVVGNQFEDDIFQVGGRGHTGPGLSVSIPLLDDVPRDFSTSVVGRYFPGQLSRLRRYFWYLQIPDGAWFVWERDRQLPLMCG